MMTLGFCKKLTFSCLNFQGEPIVEGQILLDNLTPVLSIGLLNYGAGPRREEKHKFFDL